MIRKVRINRTRCYKLYFLLSLLACVSLVLPACTASSDPKGYYALLGVPINASDKQINKAYKNKAKEVHPDKHLDEYERYTEIFKDLGVANEILSDPDKRSVYDTGEKISDTSADVALTREKFTKLHNQGLWKDEFDCTLLYTLAKRDHDKACTDIIKNSQHSPFVKKTVNMLCKKTDGEEETLLMHFVKKDYLSEVEMMLACSFVDPYIKNLKNQTAVDMLLDRPLNNAKKKQRVELINQLAVRKDMKKEYYNHPLFWNSLTFGNKYLTPKTKGILLWTAIIGTVGLYIGHKKTKTNKKKKNTDKATE